MEILRQLQDTKFYTQIDADPILHMLNIIKVIIQKGVSIDYIQISTAHFLFNNFPHVPVFHHLPKIHKNIPGHLIVSGSGSVLEPINKKSL